MIEQNAGNEGTTPGSKEKRGAAGVTAKSHDAAEKLKSAVVDQADQVRDRAATARDQTAERFRRVASELRNVGDTLRSDDQIASTLAERASRGIEGIARYVGSTDLRGFVRDTEQLARRQPALFFGSAFMIGLALGRFLKISPQDGASSSGTSASRDDRPGSAQDQNRNEQWRSGRPPSDPMGQQRYRENYDATFGRDIPSSPGEGTARGPGVSAAKSNIGSPDPDRVEESNGGRRAGRGKTS